MTGGEIGWTQVGRRVLVPILKVGLFCSSNQPIFTIVGTFVIQVRYFVMMWILSRIEATSTSRLFWIYQKAYGPLKPHSQDGAATSSWREGGAPWNQDI